MRTPLNAVIGYAGIGIDAADSERRTDVSPKSDLPASFSIIL